MDTYSIYKRRNFAECVRTVQVIKKFPFHNHNMNLLQYIYDYDMMKFPSLYEEITIILYSESIKITKCSIRG